MRKPNGTDTVGQIQANQ